MFLNQIERAGEIYPLQAFGVCRIGDNFYETLEEAFTVGGEIEVLTNIALTNYIDVMPDKEITLNLNGFKVYAHRTLTYNGGLVRVHNGGTLIVNGPGEINGGEGVVGGIVVTVKGDDPSVPATLVLNGGVRVIGFWYGVTGNGDRHNTNITVNNAYLTGSQYHDNLGIYHPQNGLLTINGGLIEGCTGIEIRAGELVVNGGEIIGTAFPAETSSNGSGATSTGVGIAASIHRNSNSLKVEINNGMIKGYSAFYESNPENKDISNEDIIINGGAFCAINGGTMSVYSENKTGFISNGIFSPEVDPSYRA